METTAQRLRQIMEERNLKQVDILERAKPYTDMWPVKLTKSDLSQYVSGKVVPGQFKLTVLGLALDVSEGWLMGLDVPKERSTTIEPTAESDGHQQEYVYLFKQLNEDQQGLVINLIKGLLSGR